MEELSSSGVGLLDKLESNVLEPWQVVGVGLAALKRSEEITCPHVVDVISVIVFANNIGNLQRLVLSRLKLPVDSNNSMISTLILSFYSEDLLITLPTLDAGSLFTERILV